jgi:hypothetical protein
MNPAWMNREKGIMQAQNTTPKMLDRFVVLISLAVFTLFLGACAVGPDYEAPEPKLPEGWIGEIKADVERADETALTTWWTLLNDPVLSSLVEQALEGNLDLKQALSRIDEARAVRGQARGLRVPNLGVGANAGGSRFTETGVRPAPEENPSAFYEAGIASTWELDFFGRVRRLVESSQASMSGWYWLPKLPASMSSIGRSSPESTLRSRTQRGSKKRWTWPNGVSTLVLFPGWM